MKITKKILGWVLLIGGILSAIYYGILHQLRIGVGSAWGSRYVWSIYDELFPIMMLISILIGIIGYLVIKYRFGNNFLRDTIIITVLYFSMAAWAVLLYLIEFYHWS